MFWWRWQRFWLENDIYRIGHVLKASPRSCINSKSYNSTENHVACGGGHAATDNLARNRNLLRNEPALLKRSDKFFILF
jgi:hypothetical protein